MNNIKPFTYLLFFSSLIVAVVLNIVFLRSGKRKCALLCSSVIVGLGASQYNWLPGAIYSLALSSAYLLLGRPKQRWLFLLPSALLFTARYLFGSSPWDTVAVYTILLFIPAYAAIFHIPRRSLLIVLFIALMAVHAALQTTRDYWSWSTATLLGSTTFMLVWAANLGVVKWLQQRMKKIESHE